MIELTHSRQIEGKIDEKTFIKVFHSGWDNMHYMVKENLIEESYEMNLVPAEYVENWMENMKVSGKLDEKTISNYFMPVDTAISVTEKNSGKPSA